jgi:alkanesulfonate monooxygenase SsuD/methylene tetrahydromethanopterin reductase-like flavin-dependent oxidoreductase (luciferase family)
MGGMSEPVLKRVARIADGWFPQFRPGDAARQTLERLREMIVSAGRKPEDVGVEGRLGVANGTPDDWAKGVEAWRELGATHLSVNTMAAGFGSVREHIEALRRFKEAVG